MLTDDHRDECMPDLEDEQPDVCPECDGEGTLGCGSCAGSGEGMYDGSTCGTCRGRGCIPCYCVPSPPEREWERD